MSIEDLLTKLHHEYLASLPEKISSLHTFCSQADVASLSAAFHKLKGTGRTYGLPEISDLAEILERICLERPEHAVTASNQALRLLEDVYLSRKQGHAFTLETDPRFTQICSVLNH